MQKGLGLVEHTSQRRHWIQDAAEVGRPLVADFAGTVAAASGVATACEGVVAIAVVHAVVDVVFVGARGRHRLNWMISPDHWWVAKRVVNGVILIRV
ncbi:hypothetical protein MLD38_004512 [Melastoma candidum]|uniref:Uncharacterized protein n=1 Tax=Melastoma candidum TaxID=119954 RepID=A0ACB9S5U7_9MYRT|nr:hypothetical protein MLD38_004512 [Melastoma candidum]